MPADCGPSTGRLSQAILRSTLTSPLPILPPAAPAEHTSVRTRDGFITDDDVVLKLWEEEKMRDAALRAGEQASAAVATQSKRIRCQSALRAGYEAMEPPRRRRRRDSGAAAMEDELMWPAGGDVSGEEDRI